jgi:hypothetical protein
MFKTLRTLRFMTTPEGGDATGGGGQGGTGGAAFVAPTTQAELDRIIADRLSRERSKFADYDDLKTKAAKFDEVEAKSKTDLEKEQERANAAEQKLAEIAARDEARKLRDDVAKEKGVSAALLRGTTREELEEHAAALAEVLPKTPVIPSPTGQGNAGGTVQTGDDMSADDIVKAATGK